MTNDANLKDRYLQEIRAKLGTELGIANIMAIPRLTKIIVNVGVKKTDTSTKDIETAKTELTSITGLSAKVSGAKQSMDVSYIPKALKAGAVAFGESRLLLLTAMATTLWD